MAVESPEDLASMFDDDEFAELAAYLSPAPGAEAVDCLVIYDRGQGRNRFEAGEQAAVTAERHLLVRGGDVPLSLPLVERGGRFTLFDPVQLRLVPPVRVAIETVRAIGLPKLDETGRLWSVDLEQVV